MTHALEFGSGFGHWLRMATAFNYRATGVEIYEDRIAYAESFGLKIIRSLDATADESSDFIFTNQVFEHLSDPRPLLTELVTKLKTGGILEIGVPESGSVNESITNSRSIPDKLIQPIGHINCFTNTALVKLCEKAGLTLLPPSYIRKQYLKIFTQNHDLRYVRAYTLAGYKQKKSCTLYFTKA